MSRSLRRRISDAADARSPEPPTAAAGGPAVGGRRSGPAGGTSRLLGLEVRDRLLDLRLVLRLAGLLDHLRQDPGADEFPDHSHARPPSGWLREIVPARWPDQPPEPTRAGGKH